MFVFQIHSAITDVKGFNSANGLASSFHFQRRHIGYDVYGRHWNLLECA